MLIETAISLAVFCPRWGSGWDARVTSVSPSAPACFLSVFVFYSRFPCCLRASLCLWTCSSPFGSVWADWRVTVPAADGHPGTQSLGLQQEERSAGLSFSIVQVLVGLLCLLSLLCSWISQRSDLLLWTLPLENVVLFLSSYVYLSISISPGVGNFLTWGPRRDLRFDRKARVWQAGLHSLVDKITEFTEFEGLHMAPRL